MQVQCRGGRAGNLDPAKTRIDGALVFNLWRDQADQARFFRADLAFVQDFGVLNAGLVQAQIAAIHKIGVIVEISSAGNNTVHIYARG